MARQETNRMTEKIGMEEKMERDMGQGKVLRRRGLLAGAAAVAAGAIAAKSAQSVQAGNGDIITVGSDINSITLETHLTGSTNQSSSLLHLSQNGQGMGLDVIADGNRAIYAWSGNNDGIVAQSNVGGSFAGVHGFGGGTSGNGVIGEATGGASAYGVWGKTDIGRGVYGTASSTGIGVQGSGGQYGVFGVSSGAASSIGVYGFSPTGFGVYGASNGGPGVFGTTTLAGNAGLAGLVSTPNTAAFAGTATVPTAFAGFFTGDVFVNGNFTVLDPTRKHGAIAHPDGSHRLLYSMESPESWMEDFGTGTLASGRAEVRLDADFAAVVKMDDYHVFLTPRDAGCKGLAVVAQRADGFTVQELNGGTSNGAFSYRVVARPKTDKKAARLAKFEVPKAPHMPSDSDLAKSPEASKDPTPSKPPEAKK
jgi:hypothetical protein